jgi:zinc transporter 5/7
MLIFFSINMIFMVVELVYGVYSNSLGLISDAFHMLSDNISLIVALMASYIAASKGADSIYTYGYSRVETLSGLFNGIFLVFVAAEVLSESVERIYEPQHIESGSLLLVSFLGLLVNMVGLVFFHDHAHGHSHADHPEGEAACPMHALKKSMETQEEEEHSHDHGHSHDAHSHDHGHSHEVHAHEAAHDHGHSHAKPAADHGHAHGNENLYGVFLHILADALGSVAVIISSIFIKYWGWYIADPICCFLISFLILASVVFLIKSSGRVLALGMSDHSTDTADKVR